MNPKIDQYGNKSWYQDGKLHRLDGPAIEKVDGTKFWYLNNYFHRLDGPAIEYPDGENFWYQDGKLHRLDGPAVEWANGGKSWYQNGKHFNSKEEWFQHLSKENKLKILWKLEEF